MRRHMPRLLLLTGALLSPMTLQALGLGEIRLNSALNQPFDADIELLSPTADELSSLRVGLASNELFERYGVDRPNFLTSFQFAVSRTRDGRSSIKVTSNRSVTEPFVTIIVEASWARGRLLREYTVLLDPPVFLPAQPDAPPAPVTTPQAGSPTERITRQPEPQPAPAPERTPVPQPEQPAETVARGSIGAGSYTVERNDTLWKIASRVNPGSRRVVNQTMIAMFRANPAAFNGNINRLRAGSVLRVPDIAEIESVSTSEASAEVARQTAEWTGAPPTETVAEANRLRLVTPAETPTAPTPAPPVTQPQPERPSATTPTTTAPTAPDRRVGLPSQGLSNVQQGVTDRPATPEPAPQATPEVTTPPVAEQPAAAAPAEPRPAAPRPRPAPSTEPAGPSLMDRLGEYWWLLGIVGLLVVGGVLVMQVLKRRREGGDSLDSLDTPTFVPRVERERAAQPATKARSDAFLVQEEDEDEAADASPVTVRRSDAPKTRPLEAAPTAVPAAPITAVRPTEDTLSSESAVRFDQQDALAEADFHMAYGLYDQAADLVKIAIDREPARRDLKLKLLEIYFVWGNKDLFLDTARDLHENRTQGGAGEWDKVLIMGKQIAPEDSMFKGEAGAAHVDLVDVNLEGGENRVDVDLFAEPQADQPAGLDLEFTSGERRGPQPAESDLDFLLDEPKRGADEDPTREIDPLARTQETPTIESPMLDRSSQTIREKIDKVALNKPSTDQTAELSLDDLGLDVDALEATDSLEDTTSIEKDETEIAKPPRDPDRSLRDNEMTQLAPSLGSNDRTMEAPRAEKFDIESTGTIYIDQVDLSGSDTVEQRRPDVDATASMKRPSRLDLDLDSMAGTAGAGSSDTMRHPIRAAGDEDRFSSDVFADRTSEVPKIDLDVGDALVGDDSAPTNKQVITTEMELSELEPVTMSEVGTKLDLARAYMDMGDPDGARSILDEVLQEGNPNQKQEAQRLLDSIR